MKSCVSLLVIIILLLAAACSPYAEDTGPPAVPSVSASSEPPGLSPAEPEKTAAKASAAPHEASKTDHNIPDVVIDTAKKSNSNYTLYEDADYIYYLPGEDRLYFIDKNDGSVKCIIDISLCFTIYGEKIYYACEEPGSGSDDASHIITEYDIKTGVGNTIINTQYPIYAIACHDGKIYFARESEIILDSGETYDNMYSAGLDGSNIKKVQDDAHSFCFYNDRVFFTSVGGAEGGGLFECDMDKPAQKREISPYIDWHFDIGFGSIVFTDESCFAYDINSETIKELPFTDYNIALAGQYAVYCMYDEHLVPTVIKAFDLLEYKEYTLLYLSDLTDPYSSAQIHATKDNIYLCIESSDDNRLEMYRINIKSGAASIRHVASIAYDE